ncbi:MAG TPA: zinc transporter ZupT [Armatimonadota bacterium]|nr:zinc transporter ZupT [Armatimonadota bacterium]
MSGVLYALGLTLFAGMATGIGSMIAFAAKPTNFRFLSVATGFSAGVMLYVSFVEIFHKGTVALVEAYGEPGGHWVNAGAFFGGMVLIGLIDHLIPSAENPHEVHGAEESAPLRDPMAPLPDFSLPLGGTERALGRHDHGASHHRLIRMGLFTALAIGIHNLPEGLATFLAALQDPKLGMAIAVAIAMHNIPEGVSVSVPIFYATGDRRRAFLLSLLSGLAEPVGAVIAFVALRFFIGAGTGVIPPHAMGVLFAGVAGIMVYISVDELLPTSRAYGKGHDSLLGVMGGMVMMALSLLLMK